ncbi:MAG: InterPro: PpiC-type peptidyl-prolyl cis-trans isomerase, PrsA protein [Pseudomonadota bacterium]|jgi:peptidyl-prolyl cis-trans isomerase C/peptidyl-prolyl cis-trans isomerase D
MKMTLPLKQLLFALSFLFCSNLLANISDSDVLAVIGSKSITIGEFNKKFNEVKSQTLNPPTKEEFLEDLVRYYVGLQEAEKKGLRNDPVIKEKMEQEMYKGLLEKNLGPEVASIKVTDEQMKAWYKENPEIRTSHILIEYKPGSKPEEMAAARKRAQEIFDNEVRNSKRPFEELVRLFSDDPLSKQTGGDIGWQNRLTLVPNYYNTALKMKTGEIKGLVETPFGFHIIKLTGKHSYENANKRQIRTAVFDEQRRQKFNKYFEALKKDYPIKVNSKLIK